jgi:hypothetical protein
MRRLLIAALGAALLAGCSSNPPPASPPATPASPTATSSVSQAASALPEGIYRTRPFTWNHAVAAIKAAGFTAKDAARARPTFEFHKTVVFTLKLQGGQWTEFESSDGGPDQVGDRGTYTATSDVLILRSSVVQVVQRFKWTLDGTALSLQPLPGDAVWDEPEAVFVYTSGPFYRQR